MILMKMAINKKYKNKLPKHKLPFSYNIVSKTKKFKKKSKLIDILGFIYYNLSCIDKCPISSVGRAHGC